MLECGAKAPAFTLPDHDGREVSLGPHGGPVLLSQGEHVGLLKQYGASGPREMRRVISVQAGATTFRASARAAPAIRASYVTTASSASPASSAVARCSASSERSDAGSIIPARSRIASLISITETWATTRAACG